MTKSGTISKLFKSYYRELCLYTLHYLGSTAEAEDVVQLSTLSSYYHTKLSCDDTDKKLTADLEAGRLEDIISLLEQSLHVKIMRAKIE